MYLFIEIANNSSKLYQNQNATSCTSQLNYLFNLFFHLIQSFF